MEPRITVLTLAVQDLEKSVAFYRDGLGWPTQGIVGQEIENGAVAFFDLPNGMKLALWPQEFLQNDTGLHIDRANNPTAFTLGYNVNSADEVDAVLLHAVKAGATVVQEPRTRSWGGVTAYFQDVDGHLWEIVYNPVLAV